jgi:hypothetical protein
MSKYVGRGRGRGQFLNAEGAKVAQRTQKRKYKNKTKKKKKKHLSYWEYLFSIQINKFIFYLLFIFFGILLRSLRNLRALCVQKF